MVVFRVLEEIWLGLVVLFYLRFDKYFLILDFDKIMFLIIGIDFNVVVVLIFVNEKFFVRLIFILEKKEFIRFDFFLLLIVRELFFFFKGLIVFLSFGVVVL